MLRAFCITVAVIMMFQSVLQADPVYTGRFSTDDFEDGSVGSWASYPPAQDTAYDPTIWVKPLRSEGDVPNRALYREITPNYAIDYEFGVRKKYDIYVNSESILSFRCMVWSYTGTEGLRLRFGFADGTDATLAIPFTETMTWRNVTVDFGDVVGDGALKKLDAVAFMAVCPHADPETVLRLGLDDVIISGQGEVGWAIDTPPIHRLAERIDLIAGRHYKNGDAVTISATAPLPLKKARVTLSRALTGEDESSFSLKRQKDGSFNGSMKRGPGPGLWRAVLTGETSEGDTVSSSMVFLVERDDVPGESPRLFISKSDVPEILKRAERGHLKNVRDAIRTRAEDLRKTNDVDSFNYNLDAYDDVYWLPTFGGYYGAIWIPNGYIRDNAVEYALSGDSEAGRAAREGLLKLASWPTFVHHHILNQGQNTYWPAAIMLTDLALSFDLVYDSMSADERSKVADALFKKGIVPVYDEYVRDNRVSSSTSNWISDAVGAIILSSAAVSNEYSDRELEPYLTGAILRLGDLVDATFDPDGAYGEGALYYSHALHCMTKSMPVLERLYGVRFPDDLLKRSHEFLIHQSHAASGRIYDYGDAFETVSLFKNTGYLGFGNFAWLIKKYRDPHLRWFYELNPGMTERDLFFLDDSVEPKAPDDLPKVKHFRDAGTAVFRSGFGEDDFIFVFRCGAFFNHHHFDQGSFFLSDRGEEFITECGRTDYYTDPWYQKLYIQAGGHSTVLAEDNPESQRAGDFLHDVPAWRSRAAITDFLEFEGGAVVSGRLDPLYKGAFSMLRRTALYFEPRTVVLIDHATGDGDTRSMSLRFHTMLRDDIALDAHGATVSRPNANLTISSFGPAGMETDIVRRPMTLNEFGRENAVTMKARGFLEERAVLGWDSDVGCFVNVMTTDTAVSAHLDAGENDEYLRLSIGGGKCYINKTAGRIVADGVETDALVYVARDSGASFIHASSLSEDGNVIFEADSPVSITIGAGDPVSVRYSSGRETSLAFASKRKPRRISLDGFQLKDWRYDNKTGLVHMTVPSGQGVIDLQ